MFWPTGFVHVSSGKSNGRSFSDILWKGRITIHGTDEKGREIERVVVLDDGEVQDNRLRVNRKVVFHVVYGQYEKEGPNIIRFKKGTNKRKHGKARVFEKLFNGKGVCHSWYNNGRLMRQRFVYDNRRVAYDYYFARSPVEFTVRDARGKERYRIIGALDGKQWWQTGGMAVFNKPMESWFNENYPFEVWKAGKCLYAGRKEDRQKEGRWVEHGKEVFYRKGYEITKRLYETPPEEIDIKEVLNLDNVQARMVLMSQISPERIAEIGTVIHDHRKKGMRLYDIKGHDVRILKVRCPSTKAFYYLNVPKDATRCEQARQWTFGVGHEFRSQIQFERET